MKRACVSRIAMCYNCDWRNENRNTATALARKHHERTGHKVAVESGNVTTYE